MLYRFHANVFALPDGVIAVEGVELRGLHLSRLCASDGRAPTFDSFFSVSFEVALDALTRLPRVDAEPDGFFVFSGEHEGRRWQIDGHLFDFDGRLHRVELHGACPGAVFNAVLGCVGWPQTPLAFELVREGVALDEAAFREWADASTS